MATPKNVVSSHESRPQLWLVHDASEQHKLWIELADRIGVEELLEPDDEGDTHVLTHEGGLIGAASVYTRAVKLGESEVHAVEVESFSTNEAHFHAGYLSLISSVIELDPELTVVDGVQSTEMTAVASDIVRCLPYGWLCEYTLIANGITVTTFDTEALAAHLAAKGSAEHTFKRL